jgi:hypothetical protein
VPVPAKVAAKRSRLATLHLTHAGPERIAEAKRELRYAKIENELIEFAAEEADGAPPLTDDMWARLGALLPPAAHGGAA